MSKEEEDKILRVIKRVGKEQKNGDLYFEILKKIFCHISKYENVPLDGRVQNIKDIIENFEKLSKTLDYALKLNKEGNDFGGK